jgi:hypothetical protein
VERNVAEKNSTLVSTVVARAETKVCSVSGMIAEIAKPQDIDVQYTARIGKINPCNAVDIPVSVGVELQFMAVGRNV